MQGQYAGWISSPGSRGKPSERAQTEALHLVVEKLEFGVLRRGHVIAARESILRLGCGNTVDLCLHQIAYTRAAQPRPDRRVLFGYVRPGRHPGPGSIAVSTRRR